MRILFVGDLHCKTGLILPRIDLTLESEQVDRVTFLGDLANDWNTNATDETSAMCDLHAWVRAHRTDGLDVDVLLGNHDIAYWQLPRGYRNPPAADWCPGFKRRSYKDVHTFLHALDPKFAILYDTCDGPLLASHAGVTFGWIASHPEIEDGDLDGYMRGHTTRTVGEIGPARGGNTTPSPLWADMSELLADPYPGLLQVVGHTPVPTVTIDGGLMFCDTFSTMSDGTPIGDRTMLLYDTMTGVSRIV